MPYGWAAAAAVVAAGISADASQKASDKQAQAGKNATQTQLQMFDTINNQQQPYRTAGVGGLNKLSSLLGIDTPTMEGTGPGHYSRPGGGVADFWVSDTPKTYTDFYNKSLESASVQGLGRNNTEYAKEQADKQFGDFQKTSDAASAGTSPSEFGSLLKPFTAADTYLAPNYQFRLDQGLGATTNFLNKTGGLVSGNTLRGINDYAQGVAGDAYGQAFDIYNTQQNNIFNRLAGIAGIGQTSNSTTAQTGTAISGNAASSIMNAGAASAAGNVGSANAISGGLNNAGSWYALSNLMNKSPGTGTGDINNG